MKNWKPIALIVFVAYMAAQAVVIFGEEEKPSPVSTAYDYCPECPEAVKMPFDLKPIMEDNDR